MRKEMSAPLQAIAERHGVGVEAVQHLAEALRRGHGTMAQFDHPELGGFGQWSAGGMTMVGRMFDDALKARVAALCADLARSLPPDDEAGQPSGWWPPELGRPVATGAQDGARYAYFPASRRLAIEEGGALSLYDTGEHEIGGVAQQQGPGRSLRFSGRSGTVDLASLRRVDGPETAPAAAAPRPEPRSTPSAPAADTLDTLQRLAALHRDGVLTDAEFAEKKAELLARL